MVLKEKTSITTTLNDERTMITSSSFGHDRSTTTSTHQQTSNDKNKIHTKMMDKTSTTTTTMCHQNVLTKTPIPRRRRQQQQTIERTIPTRTMTTWGIGHRLSPIVLVMGIIIFTILSIPIVRAANDDDDKMAFDFSGVSFMPVSCIDYYGGHMVKFELYANNDNFQCHFNSLGLFIVSVSHYMRAYFNYQALTLGEDFSLPFYAGYLNCVKLQQRGWSNQVLYGRIGCLHRDTFTSTKLQLYLYTDYKCTEEYNDGNTEKYHATKGYNIDGYTYPTDISFKPPFYTCSTCSPTEISNTFSKQNYWYDDDYINKQKQNKKNDDGGDDGAAKDDDYYNQDDYINMDDVYFAANDDDYDDGDDYYKADDDANNADDAGDDAGDDGVDDAADDADDAVDDAGDDGGDDAADDAAAADDAGNDADDAAADDADDAVADDAANEDGDDAAAADDGDDAAADDAAAADDGNDDAAAANVDDYYGYGGDDDGRRLRLSPVSRRVLQAAPGELEAYHTAFMKDIRQLQQRALADPYNWNMCDRLYKYGMWCDDECRALDKYSANSWSKETITILLVMSTFLIIMMSLLLHKRVKGHKRGYTDAIHPYALIVIYAITLAVILILSIFNFVTYTLLLLLAACLTFFVIAVVANSNSRPEAPTGYYSHSSFEDPPDVVQNGPKSLLTLARYGTQ